MATGFSPMVKNTAIILVFALCLISFAYQFINYSNPNSPVLNDAKYNITGAITNLNGSLSSFANQVSNAVNVTSSQQPSATTFLFLIFEGAFTIPKMFLSMLASSFNLFAQVLFPFVGGTGAFALTLILTLIITSMFITMIFLFIKFVRSGESER